MKVTIASVPYEIEGTGDYRDLSEDKYAGGVIGGRIEFPEHHIQIWTKQPCEGIARTFLHELLHGLAHDLHIDEMLDEHGNSTEEPVIQLSVGLNEALRSLGINIEDYIWDKN